jgi:hypothetical protein
MEANKQRVLFPERNLNINLTFSTTAFRSEAENVNKLLIQDNKRQVMIKELFCQR